MSTSSSQGDDRAGPLDCSRTSSSPAQDLHQLADEHLDVVVRVVADAGRHGLEPADVAVVVGAEQVDADVEPALPLVDVVGGVGGEVGQLAVAADAAPGPCRRRSRWCASRARRRPRTGVPCSREPLEPVRDLVAPAARAGCARRTRRRSASGTRASCSCCSASCSLYPASRNAASRSSSGRSTMCGFVGDDLLRRGRRCRRRGSRPRGPAGPRRGRLDGRAELVHLVAAVVDVELARHRRRPRPRSPGRSRRPRRPTGCGRGGSGRSGWRR